MDNAIKVYKGTNPEVDSYSVFWDNKKMSDTSLCGQLKQKGVTDIYVCGLAYDVCVGELMTRFMEFSSHSKNVFRCNSNRFTVGWLSDGID